MDHTPDQARDLERNQRHILREGLVSYMSNAKWRRAWQAFDEVEVLMGARLCWRVKTVREPERKEFNNDRQMALAVPSEIIEWIDVETVTRHHLGQLVPPVENVHTDAAATIFRRHRLPFTREDGFLRVYGYLRSGHCVSLDCEQPGDEHED